MKNIKISAVISMALLIALSMTVSACPSFCDPCKTEYGPFYVAQGETITVTAPSGPGYTYSWVTYKPNGNPDGFIATTDGTASTTTITIPSTAQTGDIYGAVVTLTQSHGSGPSCISRECIYLQVNHFDMPNLDDFCINGASDTNANKFKADMPTGQGFTYAWTGTGLDGNALSSMFTNTIKGSLNNLAANSYTATLTVKHGTRTAWSGSDGFNVYALPSGAITMPA